jgi:hypothetical protein
MDINIYKELGAFVFGAEESRVRKRPNETRRVTWINKGACGSDGHSEHRERQKT